jgi:hypothetical protein
MSKGLHLLLQLDYQHALCREAALALADDLDYLDRTAPNKQLHQWAQRAAHIADLACRCANLIADVREAEPGRPPD